jgi:hypothetical protein
MMMHAKGGKFHGTNYRGQGRLSGGARSSAQSRSSAIAQIFFSCLNNLKAIPQMLSNVGAITVPAQLPRRVAIPW